jgi:3-oxoacyl-[acyl-carrier protein] reductase
MRISLAGQSALVTGAAGGIGRAIAVALAEAGAAVAVNHLGRAPEADALAARLRSDGAEAMAVEADVSRGTDVARMVQEVYATLGAIDILINNAAVVQVKPFLQVTEEDWDRIIKTDLKSVFLCTRAVLPGMLETGGGVIINIASELAYLGRALYAPYTAAKGGVVSLTRSLAREFAPRIRVNAIAPGPVDTEMLRSELAVTGALEEETAIPLGRLGRVEEIAATAVFLASEHASFYCGEVLSPNGGALMR